MKSKMKTYFNTLVLLLAVTFVSCKKEKMFNDFQYTDKGTVLNCENKDLNPLLNEALFSFENDIYTYYNQEKPDLQRAYSKFIRNSVNGQAKYPDIASPHTVKVFNALKKHDLWDAKNPKSYLNYNSNFFNCIADNIKDQNLKITLNALVSTNSMSPKLFGTPILKRYRNISTDKYLAAYVAFDLYYAKLFNLDLSQVKEKAAKNVDFNKVPQK